MSEENKDTPIKKCPQCKIGMLLPFQDHLKCNNCENHYDFPASSEAEPKLKEPERVYTFHRYNEKREITHTEHIKESDLTEEHCFILATGFYQQFLLLPATAQDFFMRKAINEAMAEQKEAIEGPVKEQSRIITLDKSN